MDVRLPPEDLAAASRVSGAGASLSAVIRILDRLPAYPWRACYVRVHAGLALFHFRRAGDPTGEFRRVPVGLLTLAALEADKTVTLANAILRRALVADLRTVRLPAEAAAVKTPLGRASYTQVLG